jgi:ParB family chromosome partitioning protein
VGEKMAVRKPGLGKGLDSLIPDHHSEKPLNNETGQADDKDGVLMVKLSKVEPNREQPRKQFDEDSLLELAESIKQFGVLQPLLVLDKKEYYEIIAGERRWRAAKMAGIKEIPVIVKEYSEQEIVEISLIENIQRENLNPIEEAMAFKRLLEEFQLKQDEVAERVSKSRTAVTNSLRLLKLEQRVQEMLVEEMLTTGHARALLAITDPKEQVELATRIFDEKLSVRETEKLIKNILNPAKKEEKQEDPAQDAIYGQLEEKMKGIVGTKVTINRKKNNKGRIEIEYYSQEELERIIEIFESIG